MRGKLMRSTSSAQEKTSVLCTDLMMPRGDDQRPTTNDRPWRLAQAAVGDGDRRLLAVSDRLGVQCPPIAPARIPASVTLHPSPTRSGTPHTHTDNAAETSYGRPAAACTPRCAPNRL